MLAAAEFFEIVSLRPLDSKAVCVGEVGSVSRPTPGWMGCAANQGFEVVPGVGS